MKKVCILSAVNIKHMSLISLYTEKLKSWGIDFDIIYMDKYGEDEFFPAKHKYVYTNIVNPKLPKYIRGLKYFKFISFAKRILEENEYDFIIVWNDVAIFLLGTYLAKHWKGKYCLNIRDYCHQKFKPIYNIFKKAIENSAFTTLSSPGYEKFLPQYDYIHMNSLNEEVLKKCTVRQGLRDPKEKIRLTFVGNVRFLEINRRLLQIFKNDDRFELHFYGTHAEILEEFAKENEIKNAVFGGSFPVEDTYKYIDKIDIVNNLYGHGNLSVDFALSIKLYYAVYCKVPILVEPGTYMEQITKQYGIGFVVDELTDDLNDRLYSWYRNLDFDMIKIKTDIALKDILANNKKFESVLQDEVMEN